MNIQSVTQVYCRNHNAKFIEPLKGMYESQAASKIIQDGKIKYLFYKRSWFITFARYFPSCIGQGVGVGISKKHLDKAAEGNFNIILIIDKTCYEISATEFKNFVERHGTDRVTDLDHEMVSHISSSFLERKCLMKERISQWK